MQDPSLLAVRAIMGILGSIGVILNSIVMYNLCKTRLTSRLTTLLMRSQCAADGFSCLVILFCQIFGSRIHTSSYILNRLICLFWFQDQLFWFGVAFSVHNIVSISFDRLMAVLWPVVYRIHQTILIGVCYGYILSVFLLLAIPNFFLRSYEDGRCVFGIPDEVSVRARFLVVHSYLWFLLAYFVPASFVVICHVMVIRFLRQSRDEVVNSESNTTANRSLRRIVTVTTGMALNLSVFHLCESVRYCLAAMDVIDYAAGSAEQQTGALLITASFCINPCLLLYTKASLITMIRDCICAGKKLKQAKVSKSKITNCTLEPETTSSEQG